MPIVAAVERCQDCCGVSRSVLSAVELASLAHDAQEVASAETARVKVQSGILQDVKAAKIVGNAGDVLALANRQGVGSCP